MVILWQYSSHFYTLNSSTSFHAANDHSAADANADTNEIWWGAGSDVTKWVALFSCNFLNTSDSMWATIMGRVHQIMGFGSVMYIHSDQGDYLGDQLYDGEEIKTAFMDTCRVYQPYNSTPTICRVLYAYMSRSDTIESFSSKPPSIQSGEEPYYYLTVTVQPN